MRLRLFMELISDNTNVSVCDIYDGNELAVYDGKNSIDYEYFDCVVVEVAVEHNWLVLYVRY